MQQAEQRAHATEFHEPPLRVRELAQESAEREQRPVCHMVEQLALLARQVEKLRLEVDTALEVVDASGRLTTHECGSCSSRRVFLECGYLHSIRQYHIIKLCVYTCEYNTRILEFI